MCIQNTSAYCTNKRGGGGRRERERVFKRKDESLRNLKYRRNKFFNRKSWRNLPELRKNAKKWNIGERK